MAEVKIKKDKCKNCGLCMLHCPRNCLELSSGLNKRGVHFIQVKQDVECIGCGACFLMCPDACIEIYT